MRVQPDSTAALSLDNRAEWQLVEVWSRATEAALQLQTLPGQVVATTSPVCPLGMRTQSPVVQMVFTVLTSDRA